MNASSPKPSRRVRLLPARFGPADALLLFIAPTATLWLFEGLSRGSAMAALQWAAAEPWLCLVNWLLFLAPCLLLSAFRGRRTRAVCTLVLAFVWSALGLVNRYKIYYRMEPLLFTDVTQMGEAAQTLTTLDFQINFVEIAVVCGLFLAAILACAVFVRGRSEARAVLPALLGAAILALLPPLCTFGRVTVQSDMVDYARNDGTLYAALAMENHRRALMRVDYTEEDVRSQYAALAAQTPEAENPDAPNVIVVLSESFADEAWLRQYVQLDRELMPFYNQLVTTCQSGRLYVPKIGGGTSETEFEVLTGLKSQYVINPYSMGLPPMNSLAAVLGARGYRSTAIHWLTAVYYNRYSNLRMEGFDAFYTTDTTTTEFEKIGQFISDAEHYDAALRTLRESDGRDFVFVITMQNHGGYAYDDFRLTYGADQPFADGSSPETEKILSNYCYLLTQSDEALEKFLTELEGFEEPTLVVLFGDHIPPFGADAYAELGVDTTGDAGHLTPYFIWSNRENAPETVDMYAWQLAANALKRAGWDDDPFFHYVETLREGMEGEPLTGDRAGDALYDLLSYDALFGAQYAYQEGGLSPENERYEIGGEMALSGFDAALIGDQIYLEPRLAVPDQAYQLEVNGHAQEVCAVSADAGGLSLRCAMPGPSGQRLNESNALTYESAQALLRQSGALATRALPAWEAGGYELVESRWNRSCDVYRSLAPVTTATRTALTLDGACQERRSVYDLRQTGQYGLDPDGRLWIAVSRGEVKAAEEVEAYLEGHGVVVYEVGEK